MNLPPERQGSIVRCGEEIHLVADAPDGMTFYALRPGMHCRTREAHFAYGHGSVLIPKPGSPVRLDRLDRVD